MEAGGKCYRWADCPKTRVNSKCQNDVIAVLYVDYIAHMWYNGIQIKWMFQVTTEVIKCHTLRRKIETNL